jgi:hypothetical protein
MERLELISKGLSYERITQNQAKSAGKSIAEIRQRLKVRIEYLESILDEHEIKYNK